MSTIFEKLGAGQPSFSTETQTGQWEVSFPLGSNEPTAKLFSAPFECYAAAYSRPNANTTYSIPYGNTTVTACFVEDSTFIDLRGGLVRWTRLAATVPASWSEDSQYAFAFPAYQITQNVGNAVSITSIVANYSNTPATYAISASLSGLGISAGDTIYVDINYIVQSGSLTQNVRSAQTLVVLNVNGTTSLDVSALYPSLNGTFSGVTGTLRKMRQYRNTDTSADVDAARIQHDYALTDGTVGNIRNVLPIIERFRPVIAASGIDTAVLTSSTLPTAATYASMIDAGTEIAVEPSKRDVYYGLIRHRATIFVKAR
jgi:hypothetical protein